MILRADARAIPLRDAMVDAIVTDPPYDLTAVSRRGSARTNDPATPFGRHDLQPQSGGGFMGKAWDATGVAFDPATWIEALRVAKPGAHLVAFGGTRTFHWLTCAIEDAGWEIRDCLMWLYGQGFPKSLGIGGGIGTALKPAWEPIILARKPLIGTVAVNVREFGTGGLNTDSCRLSLDGLKPVTQGLSGPPTSYSPRVQSRTYQVPSGRWPANLCLDEEAAGMLDEQAGGRTSGYMKPGQQRVLSLGGGGYHGDMPDEATATGTYGDSGGPSRFFYVAKASRSEREAGCERLPHQRLRLPGKQEGYSPATGEWSGREIQAAHNSHPTVKPLALMRWLCRLVTPRAGLILDPFAGSGTTGRAATEEGFRCVLSDLAYHDISSARQRNVQIGMGL